MATVKDSELRELKDLFNSRFDELKQDFNGIKQDVNEIKQDIHGLDKRLSLIENTLLTQQPFIQKIPDLAEKVGELKNWKQISLIFITAFVSSVLTGTLGAVIGWLIKGGKP